MLLNIVGLSSIYGLLKVCSQILAYSIYIFMKILTLIQTTLTDLKVFFSLSLSPIKISVRHCKINLFPIHLSRS